MSCPSAAKVTSTYFSLSIKSGNVVCIFEWWLFQRKHTSASSTALEALLVDFVERTGAGFGIGLGKIGLNVEDFVLIDDVLAAGDGNLGIGTFSSGIYSLKKILF